MPSDDRATAFDGGVARFDAGVVAFDDPAAAVVAFDDPAAAVAAFDDPAAAVAAAANRFGSAVLESAATAACRLTASRSTRTPSGSRLAMSVSPWAVNPFTRDDPHSSGRAEDSTRLSVKHVLWIQKSNPVAGVGENASFDFAGCPVEVVIEFQPEVGRNAITAAFGQCAGLCRRRYARWRLLYGAPSVHTNVPRSRSVYPRMNRLISFLLVATTVCAIPGHAATNLRQWNYLNYPDASPVSPGGKPSGLAITLSATADFCAVSSPGCAPALTSVNFELVPIDEPFTGDPTMSAPAACGKDTAATAVRLRPQTAYKWRAWESITSELLVPPAWGISHQGGCVSNTSSTSPVAFSTDAAFVTPEALSVESIEPAVGAPSGGTRVTIRGTGFAAGDVVFFDDAVAPIESVTPDSISVVTPAHTAGAVDLWIAPPDSQAPLKLSQAFSYTTAFPSRRRPARAPAIAGPSTRILWVGAHPDDESLVAPFLGPLCRSGPPHCAMLVLTRGENGVCLLPGGCGAGLGTIRAAEMSDAAAIFHSSLEQWSLPDSYNDVIMTWSATSGGRDALVSAIRRAIVASTPDLVLTFDPAHGSSCHPAHRASGQLVLEAITGLDVPLDLVETAVGQSGSSFSFSSAVPNSADLSLDVTASWSDLLADVAAHQSQFSDAEKQRLAATPPSMRRVYLLPAFARSMVNYALQYP